MKYSYRNLYTYSGKISFPEGAPSVFDMAISLSREGRYAGAGMRWYPVALHTFVVCDMLSGRDKIHGLLHDGPECVTGDMPKPVKTKEFEEFEEELLRVVYKNLRIPFPNKAARQRVHLADKKAMRGEVYTVGTQALQQVYARCPKAEALTIKYLSEFSYADCLDAGGRAPIEFMRRYRIYRELAGL